MHKRYNSFGTYIRTLFGSAVYKVNVDAGFTCPNRDGTLGRSGCIYCNNDSFRPTSCRSSLTVSEQIRSGMTYVMKRYGAKKFLVYFQPYTNTYAPVEELERIFTEALQEPSVVGLAIGTRPDCIDTVKIDLLETLAARSFILLEYGMQSIYDKTLSFIRRGHDYHAFRDAVELTKGRGIHIGAHIIVGFPTETKEEMLAMAGRISEMPVDFLKIHQLQVIRQTPLEAIFRERPFHVFEYEEYLEFIADFLELLDERIVLQRLFATAPDDILIAPQWGKNRQEILRDIERRLEMRGTFQGRQLKTAAGSTPVQPR
jgi:uncharacterized protein